MRQADLTETAFRDKWSKAGLGLPTQYENQDFEKPSGPWASLWYLPASTRPITMGSRGDDEVVGIMQIDINYPLNTGTGESRVMADKIADIFTVGWSLVYNDFAVRILSVHKGKGRVVDGWWRTEITINWSSRLNRKGA